uniref:Carbamoyltransferase n=1 Tax=Candidatus Kentrum sp. UNK TaxID=2126344 RepID=A0A451AGR1_9GAMM|nr:MAG: carbamoyltransferase [Candidatus Kentron sp. UNK]VFK71423.1 MAG: carbamoyltransferase [Candidatus Kentron sp. UNK]
MQETRYHLGINLGHDQSAALIRDGEIIVAIQQERLDRIKYSVGLTFQSPSDPRTIHLPDEAITYCLDACGISLDDVSTITANMPGIDYGPYILQRKLPEALRGKIRTLPSHHLAHAYTAYWPSGFDDALILAVDATGSTDADHRTESYSLFEAHDGRIDLLHKETVAGHLAELSTLGFVYEYISRKAGFVSDPKSSLLSVPEAGKLMGLAPYGGPHGNWQRWFQRRPGDYSLGISAYDIFLEVAALEKRYDDGKEKPHLRSYLVDLAFKVQEELEQALLHIVALAIRNTGLDKLCLAGGVALNSVANYRLLERLNLQDIFVFPAAGDSGIAVGCGLWAYATQENGRRRKKLRRAALGRAYTDAEVRDALDRFRDRIHVATLSGEQSIHKTAEALAAGSIVARYEQRSEYGPRALGHRSILADPTFEKMRDILNARVKFREPFRPFAPIIPEEAVTEVFEQQTPAPFMLLVSRIRPEYRPRIPAVTHCDGTGRVQTLTAQDNPFLYALCYQAQAKRGGPPVVLNTSFNVAGKPIVETPEEAIETFLETDIDYLCMDDHWITKKGMPIKGYQEHLARVAETPFPRGLERGQPSVMDMMARLDRALFFGETEDAPWTPEELRQLSAEGGKFKETSALFPDNPFGHPFHSQLSPETVLLLDPLGQSQLIRLGCRRKSIDCSLDQVKLLLGLLHGSAEYMETLRTAYQYTTAEWEHALAWGREQIEEFGLAPQHGGALPLFDTAREEDDPLAQSGERALEAFEDERFSLYTFLSQFRAVLQRADYTEQAIRGRLDVSTLQEIEPTYLHYYDRFQLPRDDLGDLIRLFLLRVALPKSRIEALFAPLAFHTLVRLGLFIPRGSEWGSRIDVYCVDGLFIATDHRYMFLDEDRLGEDPVMYIGLDSLGLVHTAPRYPADALLDLCTGSGVQALAASRYAKKVYGVDLSPRAIRFARFNAQLNGVRNVEFRLGDLYAPVRGMEFDTILANPPFVPSPTDELRFRDGGPRGESVLREIIRGASDFLGSDGKLHIVSDLADVDHFEDKLDRWWQGGSVQKLLLQTADRNEILFSVAHSHHPFSQSFEAYNREIEQWVRNIRDAGLQAINFGYLFIHRIPGRRGGYSSRIIHNPNTPIHGLVKHYLAQQALLDDSERCLGLFLMVSPHVRVRAEMTPGKPRLSVEIHADDNPFYSRYKVDNAILRILHVITTQATRLADLGDENERGHVLDLVHKGILHLCEQPPEPLRGPWLSLDSWGTQEDDLGASRSRSDKVSPIIIEELESKTTPTCLSSYMRRRVIY